MNVTRLSAGKRFRPSALFRPTSVAVLGAGGAQGERVMRNLMAGGFQGAVLPVAPGLRSVGGVLAYQDVAQLPLAPDLAILCDDGGNPSSVMPALAQLGVYACVVIQASCGPPGVLRRLAEQTGVRSLGPDSFGLAVTGIGLDATLGHLTPMAGRVALVSQSAALCRAVLDWAAPRGVGFSHIVGVGTNDDVGYALVLDWLSRDPGTGAILLELRRLKDARRFLSAARAAARLRPVVAIRAGGRIADPTGAADATFAAALHRAGVLSVESLRDLLGAAETLTRVKPAQGDTLAIVSNAFWPARLAADAALRDAVQLVQEEPEPVALADLARAAQSASAAKPGGVLIVHSPEGADGPAIAALGAAAKGQTRPWIACALGEATGFAHRRALEAAGIPAFAEPEAAVRAFLHLVQDRRNRAAARELPASDILAVQPDRQRVAIALAAGDFSVVLHEYDLDGSIGPPGASHIGMVQIEVATDALFGPFIALGPALSDDWRDRTVDLPPLNLSLAHALVGRSAVARRLGDAADGLAERLVRLSALLVDMPQIRAMRFDPFAAAATLSLELHRPGEVGPALALPPYPSGLAGRFESGGESLLVRPIRPEDADAHAAFFARWTAEDVRLRFFSPLKELSAEQLSRMTQIDYDREMAFIAVRETTGETVGVARLICETLANEGEFAVVVQPDMKGRGLASHLMHRVIDWARGQGLASVVGEILAENQPMLAFARRLGFALHRLPDEPDVMEARLDLRDAA